ncbi:50S ribosomal protein L25 [Atopobacter sp. AH10]|uniref:50S ribosomal protein L25 n=1 Tax=Atopobacter sp. AH10 TaxID=2315861 RepID=UPI000EF2482B|nr:50S ribosomal protein L25 [Atopobacter sp. AH10]RLK64077.1 50S ribosomal protein L25 [Atopobacter sp. AH10]
MSLKAELRAHTGSGQSTRDRQAGRVPGVLYGHGQEPVNLTLDATEFTLLLRDKGYNAIFPIDINGEDHQVLVQDLQWSSIKRDLLSFDLLRVKKGDKIAVPIPIVLEDGDKRTLGIVEQHLSEVEVETDPTNIPESFVIDTSALKIGDSLEVDVIKAPAGVKILTDPSDVIVSVSAPQILSEEGEDGEGAPEVAGAEA